MLSPLLLCSPPLSPPFPYTTLFRSAFADQVAVALKNARLFEALRTRTAELEASNRELDSFSHSVAHDLKSPLTIVVGYLDRKSTRLNSSHLVISYAVFCLKKKNNRS